MNTNFLFVSIVMLVILGVSGCVTGPNPYERTVIRMQHVSQMNSAIVENGLAALNCPPGYRVVKRYTDSGKNVYAEYKEEYGSGRRRQAAGLPRQEFEAGDATRGRGRVTCEKIRE